MFVSEILERCDVGMHFKSTVKYDNSSINVEIHVNSSLAPSMNLHSDLLLYGRFIK